MTFRSIYLIVLLVILNACTTESDTSTSGPEVLDISVVESGFEPGEFRQTGSSSPLNIQLSQERFEEIQKEPQYTGQEQWYGFMDLGNRQGNRFFFSLDLQSDDTFLMFFDANNNKDLSDDGLPLQNEGSGKGGPGGFATTVKIPWAELIRDSPFEGEFVVWFFINKSGWAKGEKASHYSRTQLKGNAMVDGESYTVYLVDTGYNDADLTNDGIRIDLNNDGKAGSDEWFADSFTVDGTVHKFTVSW